MPGGAASGTQRGTSALSLRPLIVTREFYLKYVNFISNKIVTRKYITSLVVQWLGFCASPARNSGSLVGELRACVWCGMAYVGVCIYTYKHMGATSDCVARSGGRDPIIPGIMFGTELFLVIISLTSPKLVEKEPN